MGDVSFEGTSLPGQGINWQDDFINAIKHFEGSVNVLLANEECDADGDCNGYPAIECVIGECELTWWFIFILVVIPFSLLEEYCVVFVFPPVAYINVSEKCVAVDAKDSNAGFSYYRLIAHIPPPHTYAYMYI